MVSSQRQTMDYEEKLVEKDHKIQLILQEVEALRQENQMLKANRKKKYTRAEQLNQLKFVVAKLETQLRCKDEEVRKLKMQNTQLAQANKSLKTRRLLKQAHDQD